MRRVTAQAKWARKQKKRGRCSRCGQPRNRYRQLCDFHQGLSTAYMRAYRQRNRPAKENA